MKKIADEQQFGLDDVDITYQNTPLNNPEKADVMISHEIYADYQGYQIGYLHFTQYENVNSKDVVSEFPNRNYEKLIYINNILVQEEFRGWHISELLYDKFGEIYNEQFDGWPVAQYFVNPIAEYTFRHEVANGLINDTAIDENLIKRKYKGSDKKLWEELEDKLKTAKSRLRKVIATQKVVAELTEDEKFLSLLSVEDMGVVNSSSEGMSIVDEHELSAQYQGQEVGYLRFREHDDQAGNENKGWLEINQIYIEPEYEGKQVDEMLLERFGDMYTHEFSNWYVVPNIPDKTLFNNMVSQGLIPSSKVKDSEDQVPQEESLQTASRLRKLVRKAVATAVDMRQVNVSYVPKTDEELDDEDEDFYYHSITNHIKAELDGAEVGYIDFNVIEQTNEESGEREKVLYLSYIQVNDAYRGLGISGMLYKKFGEIYSSQFMGLPVERHFENPIAEYSFRKAVDQGWVPEAALTEDRITRNYDDKQQELHNDLQEKLPEDLRAPRQ
jgi:GNAT superfamily N-acetyltransferase